jgi:hypothetical protein
LTLALDGINGQLHAPHTLPQGKYPRYQLDRRVSRPQSHYGEEKKLHALGIEPQPSSLQSVNILNELFPLLTLMYNNNKSGQLGKQKEAFNL